MAERDFLKTVRERVVHELRPGIEVELAHDARAVHLGRAGRDEELLCDLLVRVAEGDEPEDVKLARRQRPGGCSATGRQRSAELGMNVILIRPRLLAQLRSGPYPWRV